MLAFVRVNVSKVLSDSSCNLKRVRFSRHSNFQPISLVFSFRTPSTIFLCSSIGAAMEAVLLVFRAIQIGSYFLILYFLCSGFLIYNIYCASELQIVAVDSIYKKER